MNIIKSNPLWQLYLYRATQTAFLANSALAIMMSFLATAMRTSC